MILSPRTKIDALLKKYPFLLEYLVSLAPAYAKLKNPWLRKTLGKLANLEQVASMGGLSLSRLLSALQAEVARQTGETLPIELAAEEPPSTAARSEPEAEAKPAKEERIEALKEIIKALHAGGDPEVLKQRFAEVIRGVSAAEIAAMEQSLIAEGLPEEEVKRLCDVHVLVFQESLEEAPTPTYPPGHPLHTLFLENRAAEKILNALEEQLKGFGEPPSLSAFEAKREELQNLIHQLGLIERHYLKKENQLFPRLEAHGVSGPSKVMWAIHDDIRSHLKGLREKIQEKRAEDFLKTTRLLIQMMRDMIYKEEKILFPMSWETLDEADWAGVKKGEEEIGYAWITPGTEWKPHVPPREVSSAYRPSAGPEIILDLDVGKLTAEQVNAILKHLSVDLTFVDANDVVRYYSGTEERVFPRSPGVIGRQVQNCHPPKSVHVVNRILEAFKKGERNKAEFWIQREGKFIYILYIAVRDEAGRYLGCLEVSQDISRLRQLQGERRLLDWE